MNIEQTTHGDLIVSFQDVRSPEDRAFAQELLARWVIAPVVIEGVKRLILELAGHKFRGEKGQAVRAALGHMADYLEVWHEAHGGDPEDRQAALGEPDADEADEPIEGSE